MTQIARIARFVLPLALLAGCATQSTTTTATHGVGGVPASQPASGPAAASAESQAWYEAEIQAFERADRVSPPANGQILFIGSSSFRMWSTLAADMSPLPVLNRGFGGSRTRDVLAVFDRIVTPYAPRVIIYYCGDNDLGKDNTDSQSAADGFIEFDRRARAKWPQVRMLYVAIKPSLLRWKNWTAMERANALVRDYCERTPGAAFLDVATPMLTADGKPEPTLFKEDGLHLNARGYALWTGIIKPAVEAAWANRAAR